jgi:hypothetical protein
MVHWVGVVEGVVVAAAAPLVAVVPEFAVEAGVELPQAAKPRAMAREASPNPRDRRIPTDPRTSFSDPVTFDVLIPDTLLNLVPTLWTRQVALYGCTTNVVSID